MDTTGSVSKTLTISEKILKAEEEKLVGNDHFKSGDTRRAIKKYHICLLYLKDIEKPSPLDKLSGREPEQLTDEQLESVSSLRCTSYNNLAACLLKKKNYENVIKHATEVLQIDAKNIKALFRRGQAYYYRNDIENAENDFNKIKHIDSKETCVNKYFPLLESAKKRQLNNEKELYKKMMNTCGTQHIPNGRIVGGTTATPNSWPWQVLIAYDGKFICGGTLVSPTWVVTAAHCFRSVTDLSKLLVRAGAHNFGIRENTVQDFRVAKAGLHPYYGKKGSVKEHDIGMIKLDWPAFINRHVVPACLPSRNVNVGEECYLTGWGKTSHPGGVSRTLQQAKMKVVSNGVCDALHRKNIKVPVTPNMVCAGDNGKTKISGCHGDSGGPLICKINGSWELHGAVSHGSAKCDSNLSYTVFTRITAYKGWIEAVIKHNLLV